MFFVVVFSERVVDIVTSSESLFFCAVLNGSSTKNQAR